MTYAHERNLTELAVVDESLEFVVDRIETFGITLHERHTGPFDRGGNPIAPLKGGGNRFLAQNMAPARGRSFDQLGGGGPSPM